MQEVARLSSQLEVLQARQQRDADKLAEAEAALADKVQWQARYQKRLDQYDLVLKQSRREQWDRKKYKDTLLNMSIEIEARPWTPTVKSSAHHLLSSCLTTAELCCPCCACGARAVAPAVTCLACTVCVLLCA